MRAVVTVVKQADHSRPVAVVVAIVRVHRPLIRQRVAMVARVAQLL
jgi:hypothetical protein